MKNNKFVLFSKILTVSLLVFSAESLQAGKKQWQTRLMQQVDTNSSTTVGGQIMSDGTSCVNGTMEFKKYLADTSPTGAATVVKFPKLENGAQGWAACADSEFYDSSGRKMNAGKIDVVCERGSLRVLNANCSAVPPQSCSLQGGLAIGENAYDPNTQQMGGCKFKGCVAGAYEFNQYCYTATRSCGIAHGSGVEDYVGSGQYNGACRVTGCSSGYVISGNSCVPGSRACSVSNGSGIQYYSGSSWGSCTVTACNSGYVLNTKKNRCDYDYSSGYSGDGGGDGAGY